MLDFFIFFLYLTLSIIVYGIIGVVFYKFYIVPKRKSFKDQFFDNNFWGDLSSFDLKNDDKKESEKNEKVHIGF